MKIKHQHKAWIRPFIDRYYAYTTQEYMSENHVNPVRHYLVHKREARDFHGSGRISNHVSFAHDVEVSTIATTKERRVE